MLGVGRLELTPPTHTVCTHQHYIVIISLIFVLTMGLYLLNLGQCFSRTGAQVYFHYVIVACEGILWSQCPKGHPSVTWKGFWVMSQPS